MGQDISGEPLGPEGTRQFTKALLRDLQALDQMVESGLIESDVTRIGAEQEMFLVNRGWRSAPAALRVLEHLDGPFETELGLYNLETNIEPMVLEAVDVALHGAVFVLEFLPVLGLPVRCPPAFSGPFWA